MRDYDGAQFYPEVHEKAVVDSNGVTLDTKLDAIVNRSFKEAWDGSSTPVVAEIPAGVVVTYNSQSYTGTLAASAATAPFIYMVADGNGNYDRYVSELSGSSYVWKYYGNTEIDLSDYTPKDEFNQLDQKVTAVTESTDNLIQLQYNTFSLNEVAIKTTPEGRMTITGTASANGGRLTQLCTPFSLPAGNYRMTLSNLPVADVFVENANGNTILAQKSSSTFNFTLAAAANVYIGINTVENTVYSDDFGIAIFADQSKTEYLPTLSAKDSILRNDVVALEKRSLTNESGLASSLSLPAILADANARMFWDGVKAIGYNDPSDNSRMYVRLAGFFTNYVQVTLTKDHSTFIDFQVLNIPTRPTGVQTYTMKNGDKFLRVVIDWSVFTGTLNDTTSTKFWVENTTAFDYTREVQRGVDEIAEVSAEQIGEGIGTSVFNNNWVFCSAKKATINGYLSDVCFDAPASCILTLYVGELDQSYLFVPRLSHTFTCDAGVNIFDVASQKIPVYKGQYIAIIPSTGGVKINYSADGSPLADNSFFYTKEGQANLFQLQVFGAQKIFKVNFYAKIVSDSFVQQTLESLKLQSQISSMGDTIGNISSSINIVSDAIGNKYRLKVVDGAVIPVLLDYKNVLCVGNSYTVHPTTEDTGAAFATAYWWGHWAMAASSPDVAWPKLLQDSLRLKQNDAVVTPIFGRPYETEAMGLTDNDAFVYWDNGTRKSLKANIASFSNVDCIVFFLGDNYTGSDWETRYRAMCEQFAVWFPSASFYCVGAVGHASISTAIQNVASAKGYTFIDVLSIRTTPLLSREGNFVLGDDNALHQINFWAVGEHFGDYGQLKLNEKIATAMGSTPAAVSYVVTLESQLLSLLQFNYLEDSIVSIFADASVNAILVVDANNNAITATSHSTDYGKIFTFTMPASDVSVSVAS